MATADELVQPKNQTKAAVEEAAPKVSGAGSLPDEILQIPAMQALFSGSAPALSASLAAFANRPEGKLIQSNKDALMKAGMGLYRGLDGDTGVLFNQFYLNGEELKEADKNGQLAQIAPSFDSVNQSVGQSGAENPVLKAGQVPQGFKTGSSASAAPPAVGPVPPASAGTQRQAMAARVTNMKPSSPTSGPKPGSGRLLNSILKPVV